MEIKAKTRQLIVKIREHYPKLRVNQKLYINAIATLAVFGLIELVLGIATARSFFFVFLAFWVWAIGYDLIGLYKRLYKKPLGKAFFLLLLALATNFSIMLGSQVVNDVVGVDPTKFPHTVALLSIMNLPVLLAMGMTVVYGCTLVAAPFLLMFHTLPNEQTKQILVPGYATPENYPLHKTTLAIQFVSIGVFAGFVLALAGKFEKAYNESLTHAAREFIFVMEMYPKAQCALPKGTRAAFVADEKVVTAARAASGINFEPPRDCKTGS